jgi:hypothetical protein
MIILLVEQASLAIANCRAGFESDTQATDALLAAYSESAASEYRTPSERPLAERSPRSSNVGGWEPDLARQLVARGHARDVAQQN